MADSDPAQEMPNPPDGFDATDLHLLARRAADIKRTIKGLNQQPPFDEARVLAYLDMVEAIEEPHQAHTVRQALRDARFTMRAAYGANLNQDSEPQLAMLDRDIAALLGDLTEALLPFGESSLQPADEGETADLAAHEATIEPLRQDQHALRRELKGLAAEISSPNVRANFLSGAVITQLGPEVGSVAFVALHILARMKDSRLSADALQLLLTQEGEGVELIRNAGQKLLDTGRLPREIASRFGTLVSAGTSTVKRALRALVEVFPSLKPSGLPVPPPEPALDETGSYEELVTNLKEAGRWQDRFAAAQTIVSAHSDQKDYLVELLKSLTEDRSFTLRRKIATLLVSEGISLSNADLTDANLRGADLTGADLTGAYFSKHPSELGELWNEANPPRGLDTIKIIPT